MKVAFIHDHVFPKYQGEYYESSGFDNAFIQKYLKLFGDMKIIARYKDCQTRPQNKFQSFEQKNLSFYTVSSSKKVFYGNGKRTFEREIKDCDCAVIRVPSSMGIVAADICNKNEIPYIVEVVGCAWDAVIARGKEWILLAFIWYLLTKRVVAKAEYTLYVTKEFLQRRYPTQGKQIGISDVKISPMDDSLLINKLAYFETKNYNELNLMTTGPVDQNYKGQQYVIKAIPKINKSGIRVCYVLVGGGDSRYLKELAKKLGVLDQLKFKGEQPLDKVFENLDATDLYIQPSLQEGLPRAVVEAMSRACPCIGARTGGIPELLKEDHIFERKSPDAIADMVTACANAKRMKQMAEESFYKAKEYSDSELSKKRNAFYDSVKEGIQH